MEEKQIQLAEKLFNKLDSASSHVIQAYSNQVKVDIAINIIGIVFFTLFIATTTILHFKFSSEKNGDSVYYQKGELAIVPMVICGLISFVFAIYIIQSTADLFTAIMNPDYYVIQKMLKQIKN